MVVCIVFKCCSTVCDLGSSKAQQQERKATPTPREVRSTKSPLAVGEHTASLAYERIMQGLGTDMYRGQIPLQFDPATLPRGIQIEPGICSIAAQILGCKLP